MKKKKKITFKIWLQSTGKSNGVGDWSVLLRWTQTSLRLLEHNEDFCFFPSPPGKIPPPNPALAGVHPQSVCLFSIIKHSSAHPCTVCIKRSHPQCRLGLVAAAGLAREGRRFASPRRRSTGMKWGKDCSSDLSCNIPNSFCAHYGDTAWPCVCCDKHNKLLLTYFRHGQTKAQGPACGLWSS